MVNGTIEIIILSETQRRFMVNFDGPGSATTETTYTSSSIGVSMTDSMEMLKDKILMLYPELQAYGRQGLYMFGKSQINVPILTLFEILRTPGSTSVTRSKLVNYFSNVIGVSEDLIPTAERLTLTDLMEFYKSPTLQVWKPIGLTLDQFQASNPDDFLTGQKGRGKDYPGSFLLDYMPLLDNQLYIFPVSQVTDSGMFKQYFPALFEDGVMSLKEVDNLRPSVSAQAELSIQESCTKASRIAILQSVYNETGSLVKSQGLMSASVLLPYYSKLPIEPIFKTLQSSRVVPYMRLSHSSRLENLYRLFAPETTRTGAQIPFLSKSQILWMSKIPSVESSFFCYIDHQSVSIYLTLTEDGEISVQLESPTAIQVEDVAKILNSHVDPVLDLINNLEAMSSFEPISLQGTESSQLHSIKYRIVLTQPAELNIIDNDCTNMVLAWGADRELQARYKLVSGYNQMDAVDAFIVDCINSSKSRMYIIERLSEDYGYGEKAAGALDEFLRLKMTDLDMPGKKARVLTQPGFPILLISNSLKNTLTLDIESITSSYYLASIIENVVGVFSLYFGVQLSPSLTKEVETCFEAVKASPSVQADAIASDSSELGIMSEEDDDEDADWEGGAKAKATVISLSNPNPFSKRLQEREPSLFISKAEHGYQSYSRSCPSSLRRQPVILTQAEKDAIDRDHPDSYSRAIEYQSSPDSQKYYYICPRYWSLKDNTSLTQAEVESGKYGKLIPIGAKRIGKGENIYQFDSKYHRNSKDDFVGVNPGFMSPGKHPQQKCVPCCFKNWNSTAQKNLREQCSATHSAKAVGFEHDEYIKGPTKVQLEHGRLAYLPSAVQALLAPGSVSNYTPTLPSGSRQILRVGAQSSINQSFLAAISLLSPAAIGLRSVSLSSLKKTLLDNLSLDDFVRLQNGALVSQFSTNAPVLKEPDSTLLKGRGLSTLAVRKMQSAFEKYKSFIKNPSAQIDYRYCWDLVTRPNQLLFPDGANLLLVETNTTDDSQNSNVICPTNHYSSVKYSRSKPTIIILKQKNMYQPVIGYSVQRTKIFITKLFSSGTAEFKELITNLHSIGLSLQNDCSPLASMPSRYMLESPVSLTTLAQKFNISAVFINYNGQAIAAEILVLDRALLVPCAPTTDYSQFETKWIDEYKPLSLTDTIESLYSVQESDLPCFKPILRVLDGGLTVAVLTLTNQMIPVVPSSSEEHEDIPKKEIVPDVLVEKAQLSKYKTPTSLTIQMIKAESRFYRLFQSLVRYLLLKNSRARKQIINSVGDYDIRLSTITQTLLNLTRQFVRFQELDNNEVLQMENRSCHRLKECRRPCLTIDETCVLVLPALNLISGAENRNGYHARIADELIRYPRMRDFLLSTSMVPAIHQKLEYNVGTDELILVQSMLSQSYFTDLIGTSTFGPKTRPYFETVEPRVTQFYSSDMGELKLDDSPLGKEEELGLCKRTTIATVAGKWRTIFPSQTRELVFSSEPLECSFQVIQVLVSNELGLESLISINQLKSVLVTRYRELQTRFGGKKLEAVIRLQGKSQMVSQLPKIASMITSPTYYCTNLDIILLAQHYGLPVVFYSPTLIPESRSKLMVVPTDKNYFYFVKSPGVRRNSPGLYRLLVDPTRNSVKFSQSDLNSSLLTQIELPKFQYSVQALFTNPRKKLVVK